MEYTYKKMTWLEAMNYAEEKEMFLPSKEFCENRGMYGCWTCTTVRYNSEAAYVGCLEMGFKIEKKPVILVKGC